MPVARIPETLGAEIRVSWLLIALSGAFLSVGPGPGCWLFWVAVCVAGGCLIVLPVYYWIRRADRKGLAELYAAEGGCWADWTYDPGAWRQYARTTFNQARTEQRGRWKRVLIAFLPVVGFRIWSWSQHDELPAPVWEAFAVVFAVVLAWTIAEPWRLYYIMIRSAPEARIGPHGFFQRGRYLGFGKRYTLAGVEYAPGAWPELIFTLRVRQRYGASPGAVRVASAKVRILVPGNAQAEAVALVERLQRVTLGQAPAIPSLAPPPPQSGSRRSR